MSARAFLLAAAIALMPAGAFAAAVQFAAPAGDLPVEHLRNAVYDAVLPSGRIVTPLGTSVVTGANALGFALSPDGRFAIVSNADDLSAELQSAVDPRIFGGHALAVVDVATMQVVDRFASSGEVYSAGVAAVRDPRSAARSLVFAAGGAGNAVYVFDLDLNGHITADTAHVIPIAGALDPGFDGVGTSFPATLTAAGDGRRVYVVNEGANSVAAIDTSARTASGISRAAGFFPFAAAVVGNRLCVTNEGLMRYARVADPPLVPPFATPPQDERRASSLSLLPLTPRGDLDSSTAAEMPALALDPAPDGRKIIGGAHPSAIAATADGAYAFVAMSNVDRIATVALAGTPLVVGGTELRLFDRGPYGTQPAALALSHDGSRLYVALAGLNAVAVLDAHDPLHLHRLGLLPTGWLPTALALSADDRTLFVVNTKGFGHDAGTAAAPGASAVWSTLQKIDLNGAGLSDTTLTTLKNAREVRAAAPHYPRALQNVVVIVEENKTFDAMLGDLGYGPADPGALHFGAAITPNLHALARRFALAGNFFADAQESRAAHQFIAAGTATLYALRRPAHASGGQSVEAGQDPEDYPRAGYIFNDLDRHGIDFRDYGDLVRVTGYDEGEAADPAADDPAYAGIDDLAAPTHGLGGRYAADVPAPAVLAGHVDLDYPGWNLRIRDERRAREFERDYTRLVSAGRQPRYTHIWLPADHTGAGPGVPPEAEEVADGDRALGVIVQYLSRLPSWRHTAIFILADDTQGERDHVDADRSYALVVSPYAKRRFVGMRHLSTVSVLKTAEQILGLPPLGLGDLLATDMNDFFTSQPDFHAYTAGRP